MKTKSFHDHLIEIFIATVMCLIGYGISSWALQGSSNKPPSEDFRYGFHAGIRFTLNAQGREPNEAELERD